MSPGWASASSPPPRSRAATSSSASPARVATPLRVARHPRRARARPAVRLPRRGRRAPPRRPGPHHTRPPRAPHPLRARRRIFPPSRLPRVASGPRRSRESERPAPVDATADRHPSRYAHARRRPRARRVRRRRARGALSRRRRGSAARVRVGPLHRPLARRLGTGRALRPPPRRRPVEPRRPRRELRVSVRPGFGWRCRSFERYVERRRDVERRCRRVWFRRGAMRRRRRRGRTAHHLLRRPRG